MTTPEDDAEALAKRKKAELEKRRRVEQEHRSRRIKQAKLEQAAQNKHFKEALRLLGSATEKTHRDVRLAMMFVCRQKDARTSGRYGTRIKPQKEAAELFAAALRKLETCLNNPHLAADVVWHDFPLDEVDFAKFIARADAAAGKKLDEINPNKPHWAKLDAARFALRLLTKHGLDAPLTRKGRFCRLAALLYGEPNADFLHHCRLAKREADAKAKAKAKVDVNSKA